MLNKIQLIGRAGIDPEVRSMPNGNNVANFTLATSETYKDKDSGEKKELTEWHSISAYGPVAEVIEKYVKKGDLLYVDGKITTQKYEDKEGITRYNTKVILSTLKMLGSSKSHRAQQEDVHQHEKDDLPF